MSSTEDPEAFPRWQGLTIAQLSQALSVVLSLAVASLGFNVTLLMSKEFVLVAWQKCVFAAALLALLLSIALGIWCTVNRLRDFRLTMWAARDRERDSVGAASSRALANNLGKKTWAIFWGQIGTFGVGILLTVGVIVGVYGDKLLESQ